MPKIVKNGTEFLSADPDDVTIKYNSDNKLETIRKIFVQDSVPDISKGEDGDIWVYVKAYHG